MGFQKTHRNRLPLIGGDKPDPRVAKFLDARLQVLNLSLKLGDVHVAALKLGLQCRECRRDAA